MRKQRKGEDIIDENPHKNKVHGILAHSYSLYFLFLLIGMSFDGIFKLQLFTDSISMMFGSILLMSSTLLIVWAQKSSRNLGEKDTIRKSSFMKGPYVITRSPTHWGLFFLILGFGILMNATFIVFFTIISFILTKIFFLHKQEKILEKKYGKPYLEYKESVWL